MTHRCSAGLVLVAALMGCGSADDTPPADPGSDDPQIGGQTGEETLGCLEVDGQTLAWSELSPLGFSADNLLTALGSEREARLDWADGGTTRLEIGLERGEGELRFEQREWVDDGSGAEIAAAPLCNDVVSIPMTLSLTTSDGAFAERLPLRLLAESATRASAQLAVDIDTLAGSFTPSEIDPSAYDSVLALFALTFDGDSWSGVISGQAVDEGAGSADGSASARNFPIGSF